jgi:hypothetical protein
MTHGQAVKGAQEFPAEVKAGCPSADVIIPTISNQMEFKQRSGKCRVWLSKAHSAFAHVAKSGLAVSYVAAVLRVFPLSRIEPSIFSESSPAEYKRRAKATINDVS